MIQLSLKGLAKFMTGGQAGARKVLHDFKFRDDESRAMAKYYREARNLIARYHREKLTPDWLLKQAGELQTQANSAPKQQIQTRLRSNATALKHYAAHFPSNAYDVLPDVKLGLTFGKVLITVTPDLHVRAKGKEKLLKLEFGAKPPKDDVVKIISQAMFEAARLDGMDLKSSQVLYVDVPRGRAYNGARLGAQMRTNIEAACQNIAAIWDSITP